MDRIDGKGVHPTIRPRTFHSKSKILKRRKLIKVITLFLPTDERLGKTNMSFGHFDSKEEDIVLNKLIELGVFGSYETLEEPMYGGEIVCGGMGDYSMNHADPSRPPPKHGWIHSIMRYAAVVLAFMMLTWTTACKKDPTPTPDNPNSNDTIPTNPVVPTRDIVIDWDWGWNIGWAPSKDSVAKYCAYEDVRNVYINLTDSLCSQACPPAVFHRARDTLQTRFDMSPKVRGSGKVVISRFGHAHWPSPNDWSHHGMALEDSVWFAAHGYHVKKATRGHTK